MALAYIRIQNELIIKENENLTYIKVKDFCSLKNTIKKVKRQATEEEIFAIHIQQRSHIWDIYRSSTT